jgi:hypothetical protein
MNLKSENLLIFKVRGSTFIGTARYIDYSMNLKSENLLIFKVRGSTFIGLIIFRNKDTETGKVENKYM